MRKHTLILLLLFCACFSYKASAVAIRDSVTISIPPHTDTTCPGDQVDFTAVESDTSFNVRGVSYHWFVNGVFTGVTIDTFHSTALLDGDVVFCRLHFVTVIGALSFPDSSDSNPIIIHRSSAIPPGVIVSLIAGSNPDCAGHPLTFSAYPINGGSAPQYQWCINHAPVPGATATIYTNTFGGTDTVSCYMISNSWCRTFDTAQSNVVPIVHIHLTAAVNIVATKNPICAGALDTFSATLINPGSGFTLGWYVNGRHIAGVIGDTYITDSLPNAAIVYCMLHTVDSCISNDTAISNVITMTVIANLANAVTTTMVQGSNPGCLDSTIMLKASFSNFGVNPGFSWYINGVPVRADSVIDTTFLNGDVVTFRINATVPGCYMHDTLFAAPYLMLRDSTPATPLISLIGNLLVANHSGHYSWYGPTSPGGPIRLITGITTQTYHPPYLGYYYAIRDTGNCPSDTSNIIYISLLDVERINTPDVKLYPNPTTTGMLNLDWGSTPVDVKLDIYSILGQGLIHEDISNKPHYELDMSYLPAGNYMLVLRDKYGGKTTYKIAVTK